MQFPDRIYVKVNTMCFKMLAGNKLYIYMLIIPDLTLYILLSKMITFYVEVDVAHTESEDDYEITLFYKESMDVARN